MNDLEKIRLQEIIDSQLSVHKRFVLINSQNFTDQAYEYLLELVDAAEAIAFISDTRKIYTQGNYFGGDLWEDTLFYFGKIALLNSDEEIITEIESKKSSDRIDFQGANGITLQRIEKVSDTDDTNTILIGYDIDSTINKDLFEINSTSKYHLGIEDGKIKVNEYIPMNVIPQNFEPFELDDTITTSEYRCIIIGNNENKYITITSNNNEINYTLSNNILRFVTVLETNIDKTFTIDFNDDIISNTLLVTQTWLPACVFGKDEIDDYTFYNGSRYLIKDGNLSNEITINQEEGEYAYFACPSEYESNICFRDNSTGLVGGWQVIERKPFYSMNIQYTIFRTRHSGLGTIKWKIEQKD